MQKLVIQTQYMENYAAMDWDGQGECPQGWKFKGGSTYVLPNCGNIDADEVQAIVAQIESHITTNNDYTREYILSTEVVDWNAKVCEDWETITEFNIWSGTPHFMKVTDNREDGWMRKEILEKIETWSMGADGYLDRVDYKAEYLMDDGDFVTGDAELSEWFKTAEAA